MALVIGASLVACTPTGDDTETTTTQATNATTTEPVDTDETDATTTQQITDDITEETETGLQGATDVTGNGFGPVIEFK